MSRERWTARALNGLMEYGPWLPLKLTEKRHARGTRILGLVLYALWFFPAMAVCLIPFIALLLADIVADVLEG